LKGGIILFALAIVAVVLIAEGIYVSNFITKTSVLQIAVRETDIIESVNLMEFIKNSMQQALDYSFYQASYDVARKGGYDKLTIGSYNCAPYWRYYTSTIDFPTNPLDNLSSATKDKLNQYASALSYDISIMPTYNDVSIVNSGDIIKVSAIASKKLGIRRVNFYSISDNGNFSSEYQMKFFDLFQRGKANFIDSDGIESVVQQAIAEAGSSSADAITQKVNEKLDSLESSLSDSLVEVKITDRNIEVDTSKPAVAVRVLISITDNSEKYPVYDGTTDFRFIKLNFYIVTSSDTSYNPIILLTNQCS